MPYSLIVYDKTPKLTLEMHLGPAWYLATYWTFPASKMGLRHIADMLTKADAEEGFALNEKELIDFADELSQLKRFWSQPSASVFDGEDQVVAPDDLIDKLSKIQTAVLQAFGTNQTISIC